MCTVATGKDVGGSLIPGDARHAFPAQFAAAFHPLLTKAALCISEPLKSKGGTLLDIYKGAGDESCCGGSRGILLKDDLAKLSHRHIRNRLLASYEQFAAPNQCASG